MCGNTEGIGVGLGPGSANEGPGIRGEADQSRGPGSPGVTDLANALNIPS